MTGWLTFLDSLINVIVGIPYSRLLKPCGILSKLAYYKDRLDADRRG